MDSPTTPPTPTVIVVEDEESLREDLVEFLEVHGFDARGVVDGTGLDQALAEAPADLIVLDVLLPGENGFQIARRLRRDREIGILMLTCLSGNQDQVEGLEAGADAYLVKDADLGVVEATLRTILRRLHPTTHGPATPEEAAMPAAPSAKSWIMDPLTRSLGAPNGRSIKLTGTEKSFLEPLLDAPGMPVDRGALVGHLGKPDTEANRRNLDACAQRLRRKVEAEIGLKLPLDSIYGSGYVFAAQGQIAETAEP